MERQAERELQRLFRGRSHPVSSRARPGSQVPRTPALCSRLAAGSQVSRGWRRQSPAQAAFGGAFQGGASRLPSGPSPPRQQKLAQYLLDGHRAPGEDCFPNTIPPRHPASLSFPWSAQRGPLVHNGRLSKRQERLCRVRAQEWHAVWPTDKTRRAAKALPCGLCETRCPRPRADAHACPQRAEPISGGEGARAPLPGTPSWAGALSQRFLHDHLL